MTFYETPATGDGGLLARLLYITYEILHAEEISHALEPIARSVAEVFGFKYVTIVAADAPGGELYRRVLLGFDDAIVKERLGEHIDRVAIMGILPPESEILPYCFYNPAERELLWKQSIYTGYRPLDEPRRSPDAWHERDTLTLVLPDRDGNMLGYLSADAPIDGKVPSLETLRRMQLFVNLVGLALANSRSAQAEMERRRILEENVRVQNEFFSMVSHEVRSPLAAIRGATALLHTHFETLGLERRQELLGVLNNSTTRLSTIFEDFLLLSRMDAGHLSLRIERVSPVSVIEESMARMRSEHPERTFNAAYLDPVPPILADEGRTIQVLTNLLSNAVKYGNPEAAIHIEVKPAAADRLQIAVVNEGGGIAEKDRERLFTRFGHLSSADGSTGLGLYICRELITKMRGTIGFESDPGKLTSFWFTLPRA
ncbi:MAG TPA: HAMP domain-containing sensor histidine kinase [Candidatus Baltobacteraceae bacterium]|nr:HAMP domain-containing sensor histidine kinase [Candidatus Baltobacteraceae bacterium]